MIAASFIGARAGRGRQTLQPRRGATVTGGGLAKELDPSNHPLQGCTEWRAGRHEARQAESKSCIRPAGPGFYKTPCAVPLGQRSAQG